MTSVYEAGTAAHRDATKWLVGFVPVATIVSAGFVLGPRVVDLAESDRSGGAAISDRWPAAAGVLVIVAGLVAIVGSGSRVLSAQPTSFATVLRDRKALAVAFGQGVGAPYYFDSGQFVQAMEELQAAWDSETRPAMDEAGLQRAVAAVDALRSWHLHAELVERYRAFCVALLGGVVLIGGGFVVAAASLGPEATITTPTPVLVEVRSAETFERDTGCTDVAASSFWAVGGTWDEPALAVDGPGCTFDVTWLPEPGQAEVRPVSSG